MNVEAIVRDFCAAVSRCDLAEILGYFAPDAVYHNIPMDPVRGHAEIEATLRQFLSPGGGVEFEIEALASTGRTVLTERVDRIVFGGKRVEIPVMGAFEIDANGKIAAWRDYFDLQQLMKQIS